MTFFSDETVEQLVDAAATVKARAYDLIGAFLSHDYASDPAREHAHHGFSRRVSMLSHCIRRVFRDLPPDLDGLPDESVVIDATINIQAFVFNAFGALDNLAWIWVSERVIKRADGRELDRTQIGLTDKYATVRASFKITWRRSGHGLRTLWIFVMHWPIAYRSISRAIASAKQIRPNMQPWGSSYGQRTATNMKGSRPTSLHWPCFCR